MNTRRLAIMALSIALLNYTLPQAAWADGDHGTKAEERSYAQREAQAEAEGLENFSGGWAAIIATLLTPIVFLLIKAGEGIVHVFVNLFSGGRDVPPEGAPDTAPKDNDVPPEGSADITPM